MNYPIAEYRKPASATVAIPGRRLAHKIRFVVGLAISTGGASVLFSDMMRLIASLG